MAYNFSFLLRGPILTPYLREHEQEYRQWHMGRDAHQGGDPAHFLGEYSVESSGPLREDQAWEVVSTHRLRWLLSELCLCLIFQARRQTTSQSLVH